MTIIIAKDGLKAQAVPLARFESEDELQRFIAANPNSIPIGELGDDKTLLVVAREFETNSGPIDVLAIDSGGDIYIIETKLYKNREKRKIAAQVLDYGAALWKRTAEEAFLASLETRCKLLHKQSLTVKLKESFNISNEEVDQIIETVKANFQEGVIKFIVLLDEIEDRLKDLILYLNENSKFDIYAVEFKHYTFEGLRIIIPSIFGNQVRKTVSTGRTKLDLNALMETLDDQTKRVWRNLLDYSKEIETKLDYLSASVTICLYKSTSRRRQKLSLFSLWKSGEVSFSYLGWQLRDAGLSEEPAHEMYQKLAELFNAKIAQSHDGGIDRRITASEIEPKMAEFKDIIRKAVDDINRNAKSL